MAEYQGKRFKPEAGSGSTGAHGRPQGIPGSAPRPAGTRFAASGHASQATGAAGGAHRAAGAPRPAQSARASRQDVPRIARAGEQPVTPVAPAHGRRGGEPQGKRPRRKRRILPMVLIGLGVVLLLVAGGILGRALIGYHEAEQTYDDLATYAQVDDTAGTGIPTVDFDQLSAINPDVVAWIYVPGTVINYPVVQGEDNTEYLSKLFDGTANSSGSIFLDSAGTAPGMVDQQTTLYGHHMNNRRMFYEIDETARQERFDQIGDVYYITRDTTYRCRPLMTSVVDETYIDARTPTFTDKTLTEYLQDIRTMASAEAADLDERIAGVTKVLTLVTCNWETGWVGGDVRTVMVLSVEEETPTTPVTVASEDTAA